MVEKPLAPVEILLERLGERTGRRYIAVAVLYPDTINGHLDYSFLIHVRGLGLK